MLQLVFPMYAVMALISVNSENPFITVPFIILEFLLLRLVVPDFFRFALPALRAVPVPVLRAVPVPVLRAVVPSLRGAALRLLP